MLVRLPLVLCWLVLVVGGSNAWAASAHPPQAVPSTAPGTWFFSVWWILWLLMSILVGRDPSYYPTRLHQLVNYRIFMQSVRSRHADSELQRWGWGVLLALGLGLTMTQILGGPPVPGWGDALVSFPFLAPFFWFLALILMSWAFDAWLRLLGWAVEWEEMVHAMRHGSRALSHLWVPLFLLWALVLAFGNPLWKSYISSGFGVLLLVSLFMRWFRQGRMAYEFGTDRLLLLIFYICTFEILPLTLLAHFILHGRNP
jgi:hypothetical protein